MSFADRHILVTGAASGIGMATARHLAEGGAARLVLVDCDAAALRRVALPCPIEALPGDVADEGFWNAIPMFAERVAAIGRDAAFAELAAMATPLRRYAKPAEIAAQIGFLLSSAAALITGACLVSDGGYTL